MDKDVKIKLIEAYTMYLETLKLSGKINDATDIDVLVKNINSTPFSMAISEILQCFAVCATIVSVVYTIAYFATL